MSQLSIKLEEYFNNMDRPKPKPSIDLESATSLNDWCKLYQKKYGKMSTGVEQAAILDKHPEWMDEYGRKVWASHQRKERKENKDNDIDYEVRGSP